MNKIQNNQTMDEATIAAIHAAIEAIRAEYSHNNNIMKLRDTGTYVLVFSKKIGFVLFVFDLKGFIEHPERVDMAIVDVNTQNTKTYQVQYSEYASRTNISTELAFYERYIERYIQEINQQETNQQ